VKSLRALCCASVSAAMLMFNALAAWAAPPVRIAVVPGGGSGMEQEVCDRIVDRIQDNADLKVGTVNPDWFAVITIADKSDLMAQTTRVNGTLTIKTRDGHIINTISVQSNKQDFNLNPGTPAPMNKALVESAVREVVAKLTERAILPIQDAVKTEIATRDTIIQAHNLADEDKYDEALDLLKTITPETPHFKGARDLISEYQMEADALDLMNQAKANVKSGKVQSAVVELKAINRQSKRYRAAVQMIASLNRGGARTVRVSTKPAVGGTNPQLKALQEQKKALEQQRKAIEAQEAALMRNNK
jgi:hypothetical protein